MPGVGGDLAGAGGDGPLETPFEVGRKARVADEDVGLPGQQQAERVDVGRADGGPVFVDDRHLGVQMAAVVFEDSHAVGEKLAVEGAGGVLLQGVVGPALREQGDPHTPPAGFQQRLAEAAPGQEIGVGEDDLAARLGDGGEVGVLDVAAVTEVVADEEAGLDAAILGGRWQGGEALRMAPPERGPGDQLPDVGDGAVDRPHQRPFDAHRVVEARAGEAGLVQVADDVDAADEGEPPVDHRDLAVQAAQAMAPQREGRHLAAVDLHIDVRRVEGRLQVLDEVAAAEAVHQQPHAHAPAGGPGEGGGDAVAGVVVGEDVGLEEDLGGGAVDRRLERGKELGAVLEQGEGVAAQPGDAHRLRRCAGGR